MSLHRPAEGSGPLEPSGPRGATHEQRRAAGSRLASGTLSGPVCDAPPAPPERPLSPTEPLSCGYCSHEAAVRDFLTLGDPVRPTVVAVHVRSRPPLRARSIR